MADYGDNSMREMDDEAARLTDALLRGEPVPAHSEASLLLEIARGLDELIAPRQALTAEAQARVRSNVEAAWAQRAAPKPGLISLQGWMAGWVAAAAALVLVVLSIPPEAGFPLELSGLAAGSNAAAAEISWRATVFVLGSLGLMVYLLHRLRR